MKQIPVEKLVAGKTYLFQNEKVVALKTCLSLEIMLKNRNEGRDKYRDNLYYEEMCFMNKQNKTIGFFYQGDTLLNIK